MWTPSHTLDSRILDYVISPIHELLTLIVWLPNSFNVSSPQTTGISILNKKNYNMKYHVILGRF